jgi:hypothetical protein
VSDQYLVNKKIKFLNKYRYRQKTEKLKKKVLKSDSSCTIEDRLLLFQTIRKRKERGKYEEAFVVFGFDLFDIY